MLIKVTIQCASKQEPEVYTNSTYDWPQGIYIPAPGDPGGFPAIVRWKNTCYAVTDRYISKDQGHVSNKYVRAPKGTIITLGDDHAD